MNRVKTIFCDIDGTLIRHHGDALKQLQSDPVLLDGVLEKFIEWDRKGYNIILTTGRKESARPRTEKQLEKVGLFYDQLIMGIGGGPRYLINDLKPNSEEATAQSINLKRNDGIKSVKI